VEIRDLLEVLGLEVVVPEDVEVMLDELRPLLLDRDCPRPERRVLVGRVLLDDPVAGLGLDASLLRVIDATGQIAMGSYDGRWGEPSAESGHLGSSGAIEGSGDREAGGGAWISKCPSRIGACQTPRDLAPRAVELRGFRVATSGPMP